ncbi:hypothetical protein BCR36DRAFT_277416 [Piromyces finnis]|uniref:RRM domain-containing protein n=1 Tax=Piromyces finnis TaxID=1754191 RepID=A0A1Y1VK96_9FUNG|nr:hypothetical protein BCR36DRAFT_277416 [Piromyces finnis]|eukprot:ORX58502.1 hypothetical protein BCR36DRAFT_277416 [Piromyces finnis]
MNEREFQNMFIFNPGFEAATLKIPTPNKDGRKQIIGFAKFHTKMDALNAMEVLTGRQIDFEKGSVLKAEMAKKNLHTKKTMMNMYYPASSMKNTCMQYHSMMPDNVNNCMNFNNNNNMVNNLCNQLIKDDSNVYQINNMNRGMNLPTSTGIGPLTNNGRMCYYFTFIMIYFFKIHKKLIVLYFIIFLKKLCYQVPEKEMVI